MAMTTLNTRLVFRRDTLENWETNNPILMSGEPSIATDAKGNIYLKIGNGIDAWTDLPIFRPDKIQRMRQYKTLNPTYEIF